MIHEPNSVCSRVRSQLSTTPLSTVLDGHGLRADRLSTCATTLAFHLVETGILTLPNGRYVSEHFDFEI